MTGQSSTLGTYYLQLIKMSEDSFDAHKSKITLMYQLRSTKCCVKLSNWQPCFRQMFYIIHAISGKSISVQIHFRLLYPR